MEVANTLLKDNLNTLKPIKKISKRAGMALWISRIIIWVAILLTVFPMIAVVAASMSDTEVFIQESIFPAQWTLKNYIKVIKDTDFLIWIKNSLIVCTSVAFIQLFLTIPAAFAFSKLKFVGRKNGLMALMLLQIFPNAMALPAILGIAYKVGAIDHLWALILIISGGNAYNIWLLKGFMDGIPKELSEVAYVDGASHWKVFTQVILPLTRNMLIVIFLFAFIGPYSEFVFSAALIKNPEATTVALGMKEFITNNFSAKWAQYSAAAIMSSLPLMILFSFTQKYIAKGITAGSVKG